MAQSWRYYLARSSTLEIFGELKRSHDRKLDVDLNKSGSAGCWIPLSSQLARTVWPWSTALVIAHDDDVFWSGPNINRTTSLKSGRISISAVGWFERLNHLLNQDDKQYPSQDIGAIISDQIDLARIQDPDLPITMGTVETSVSVTYTARKDSSFGSVILSLVDVESGVDWEIDPVTRELNIFARRGVDRPEIKWTYLPNSNNSNLDDIVETIDGSELVNDHKSRGTSGTGEATDLPSQLTYGVFQEVASLSDVVNSDILIAYSNAEIVYRSQPRTTYQLIPKPNTKATVPKFMRDFDIGDTTYLTARRDDFEIVDQAIRIFGVGLDISDLGTETLRDIHTTYS